MRTKTIHTAVSTVPLQEWNSRFKTWPLTLIPIFLALPQGKPALPYLHTHLWHKSDNLLLPPPPHANLPLLVLWLQELFLGILRLNKQMRELALRLPRRSPDPVLPNHLRKTYSCFRPTSGLDDVRTFVSAMNWMSCLKTIVWSRSNYVSPPPALLTTASSKSITFLTGQVNQGSLSHLIQKIIKPPSSDSKASMSMSASVLFVGRIVSRRKEFTK